MSNKMIESEARHDSHGSDGCMTIGLATVLQGASHEPVVVKDQDGRHPRGPPAVVHCLCIC